ncbi:HalD/BesD family halogenase [Streptomyces sp. NPDC055243]|uniref:HalD/BesD family halogenase n=1 Tax=Streptomyces sp. NPDC055243 TaxID=3365720 RepID=UPI0037CD42F6
MLSLPIPAPPLSDHFAAEGCLRKKLAVRRDFAMAATADSPRHMTTLGGHTIDRESTLIPRLYRDRELLAWLGDVSSLAAVEVADPLERHVLNILHRPGDTHGAHTDDYPLALVLFIEAPADPADGGLLHYTPRTGALDATAERAHHRSGDGYLLRADTTAHHVTALRRPGIGRTVLNFAYTTPDRQRARTSTTSALYAP